MQIPISEIQYRDTSPASKKNKVNLAKSLINQLTKKSSCSEQENRENRVQFLADLINSDKKVGFRQLSSQNSELNHLN